jgi:hypothetical protein
VSMMVMSMMMFGWKGDGRLHDDDGGCRWEVWWRAELVHHRAMEEIVGGMGLYIRSDSHRLPAT